MKKYILFISLFTFALFFSQQNPVEYMEKLNAGNEKTMQETWGYLTAIAKQKSARKIEKRRKQVEMSIRESLRNVKLQKGFNGSTEYKDSVVSFLNFNLDLMTGKVEKLVDLEEISQQSFDAMEAYILYQRELKILSRQRSAGMRAETQKFAEANNVNLIETENELEEKIKKGFRVLNYKEDMFLVFARCFMYEQVMLESMQENQLGFDYAQAGVTLLDLVEVSKEVIDTIPDVISYDKSLRQQTHKALDFFTKEAEEMLPAFAEFSSLQNEFETYSKQFEKLSRKEKTQEKVNEYNKKVNELNAASKKFNSMLQQFNKKREESYNSWNTVADRFIEKHIPD